MENRKITRQARSAAGHLYSAVYVPPGGALLSRQAEDPDAVQEGTVSRGMGMPAQPQTAGLMNG
jgi:hypothetical protein